MSYIMVIAPLSANMLSKIAGGLCDNLLTCVVRAWDYSKPMFVAPPVSKRLACGDYGNGAMTEPSLIHSTVRLFLESWPQPSD
ncbi:Phosphopantothenoylcysteine decarboxylase [Hibiscus syriacus]|uniref:phosphopantothenoylcysteine decarboxylase n=1 Tax=Hibiscus syriacus TaxID=106335 RepID=A0A6A3CM52_HIBSY|nr:Phosphopantothenoylcysteine decarboxylase [Hibiscus syriacus]